MNEAFFVATVIMIFGFFILNELVKIGNTLREIKNRLPVRDRIHSNMKRGKR